MYLWYFVIFVLEKKILSHLHTYSTHVFNYTLTSVDFILRVSAMPSTRKQNTCFPDISCIPHFSVVTQLKRHKDPRHVLLTHCQRFSFVHTYRQEMYLVTPCTQSQCYISSMFRFLAIPHILLYT